FASGKSKACAETIARRHRKHAEGSARGRNCGTRKGTPTKIATAPSAQAKNFGVETQTRRTKKAAREDPIGLNHQTSSCNVLILLSVSFDFSSTDWAASRVLSHAICSWFTLAKRSRGVTARTA